MIRSYLSAENKKLYDELAEKVGAENKQALDVLLRKVWLTAVDLTELAAGR